MVFCGILVKGLASPERTSRTARRGCSSYHTQRDAEAVTFNIGEFNNLCWYHNTIYAGTATEASPLKVECSCSLSLLYH